MQKQWDVSLCQTTAACRTSWFLQTMKNKLKSADWSLFLQNSQMIRVKSTDSGYDTSVSSPHLIIINSRVTTLDAVCSDKVYAL